MYYCGEDQDQEVTFKAQISKQFFPPLFIAFLYYVSFWLKGFNLWINIFYIATSFPSRQPITVSVSVCFIHFVTVDWQWCISAMWDAGGGVQECRKMSSEHERFSSRSCESSCENKYHGLSLVITRSERNHFCRTKVARVVAPVKLAYWLLIVCVCRFDFVPKVKIREYRPLSSRCGVSYSLIHHGLKTKIREMSSFTRPAKTMRLK